MYSSSGPLTMHAGYSPTNLFLTFNPYIPLVHMYGHVHWIKTLPINFYSFLFKKLIFVTFALQFVTICKIAK